MDRTPVKPTPLFPGGNTKNKMYFPKLENPYDCRHPGWQYHLWQAPQGQIAADNVRLPAPWRPPGAGSVSGCGRGKTFDQHSLLFIVIRAWRV
jgi:hypothetical protein